MVFFLPTEMLILVIPYWSSFTWVGVGLFLVVGSVWDWCEHRSKPRSPSLGRSGKEMGCATSERGTGSGSSPDDRAPGSRPRDATPPPGTARAPPLVIQDIARISPMDTGSWGPPARLVTREKLLELAYSQVVLLPVDNEGMAATTVGELLGLAAVHQSDSGTGSGTSGSPPSVPSPCDPPSM
jgi:hypothetical protein